MIIGVPKEIMPGERRVSVVPETAKKLVNSGNTVLIEQSAGAGAFYSDDEYIAAGAEIVGDAAQIYSRAELILKVKEPQYNTERNLHEIEMMYDGQYLITFIHPASPANFKMVEGMARKGVIGMTLDGIPRISRAQTMDALSSMSMCAGYKGMLMAADHLAKFVPQVYCAVGMMKPVNVLVIGAGVAGLQAISTAKRLGAVVYACDIRPEATEQADSLGAKIIDLTVPAEIAMGEGGYANFLPSEWLNKEREILAESIKTMDIVFCGALVPNKIAPVLITEDMVRSMKPGSVIVDISIDQGGNCAITAPGEVAVKHGVSINGIKNLPGLIPISSTWMFAKNTYNLVNYLMKDGKLNLDKSDDIVSSILTTIGGEIVHAGAREAMGI
jgi:NAD(P) transhydrogenase subunit alpha